MKADTRLLMGLAAVLASMACFGRTPTWSVQNYGMTKYGEKAQLYTLTGAGNVSMDVTDYGCRVVRLLTPDRAGRIDDITIGFDEPKGYETTDSYIGAVIGRFGNRIAKGKFTLDGVNYTIATNDVEHAAALHGGVRGFDGYVWKTEPFVKGTDVGLVFTRTSAAGESGFPGAVQVKVTYTLTADDVWRLEYEATTDQATPINLTNHVYFDLHGWENGTILDHELQILASKTTPVDRELIPTGEFKDVAGTPFDFRTFHVIGDRINDKDTVLQYGPGYDHNWVFDKGCTFGLGCILREKTSGRQVEVWTDQPGVQFYAGNYLRNDWVGKDGKKFRYRGALALETQHFPDSVNHPNFPSVIVKPGEVYRTKTEYRFGVWVEKAHACAIPTEWGEKVTPENAWQNYPRPQMTRQNWTNLNGLWDYAVTPAISTPGRPEKWDGKILVPFAPESKLSGVGRLIEPDQFLWYTRKITCSKKPGERILLHFGAVDFRAMVFIGHEEVSDVPHEGGNVPFTLDITDFVKDGENELTVCAWDPTEANTYGSRSKQGLNPAGCFYTRVSGIWQTVWMETVPVRHIEAYKAYPNIDEGTVTLAFEVSENPLEPVTVKVEGCEAVTGVKSVTIKLPEGFKLWSPETPNLYTFTATCGKDKIEGYFGMRKFAMGVDKKGILRFFLNNKPTYIIGTLDQGWWPDGLLTPPSDEAMAHDIQTLKDCGFNMMRKHIKVEPLRYYYLCDKLGIMVLQDLPDNYVSSGEPMMLSPLNKYGFSRLEMREIMDLLQAVPSIVMWVPYNEGWSQPGEFLTHEMLDFVRRYDTTRLVDGPSGCWDWEGGHLLPNGWSGNRVETEHKPAGVCEAADAVDMHLYRGPAMFKANPRRVSFLGEFGGLGHPVEGHLWEVRTGNWGYGGIEDTKTPEGLEKTYLGLMDQVVEMAKAGLSGSVYTQTTDVEGEINGLMTYDRKVLKIKADVLKAAHQKILDAIKE